MCTVYTNKVFISLKMIISRNQNIYEEWLINTVQRTWSEGLCVVSYNQITKPWVFVIYEYKQCCLLQNKGIFKDLQMNFRCKILSLLCILWNVVNFERWGWEVCRLSLQVRSCLWIREQPGRYRIQNPNSTGEYKALSPEPGTRKGLVEHAVYKASVNGYSHDVKWKRWAFSRVSSALNFPHSITVSHLISSVQIGIGLRRNVIASLLLITKQKKNPTIPIKFFFSTFKTS
jgi:hypothetical protein